MTNKSSQPVTQGVVDFFDASADPKLIASVEVNSAGKAEVTLILPVGTHTLTAELVAKNAFTASTSAPVTLTVTPAETYLTMATLAATGSKAGYNLSADLLAFGKAAPAATTLSFEDASNGNATLGLGTLGKATFGLLPQVTYPTGSGPASVAVADFNGDGIADLVVTNQNDGTVTVQLGNGDGTFAAAKVIYTLTNSVILQVLAGDFNGDGKPDYALLTIDGAVVMALGNGDGTFAAPKQVMAAPDGGRYAFSYFSYAMVAGDFNNDGRLDLAITDDLDGTVLILLGYGDGTFQLPVAYAGETSPQGIAVADVNADGKPDLIVTNSAGNTVSVLLGNGDGTFQQQVTYAVGKGPLSVIAVDLNGDGAPDIAVANMTDDTVSVLLNKGGGTFSAQTAYATGVGPYALVAADLNADGIPDLAVVNFFANTVSILNGKGAGAFAAQTTMAVGGLPTEIAVGDFTGGGLNSLAVANFSSGTVSVLLGAQTLPASVNNVVLTGATVHNVDAVYVPGSADAYKTSTSNVVELNGSGLGPAATTTAVTAAPSPGYAGYNVTLTATMSSPIGVLATGTVSFYDGATLLGTSNLGTNRQATLQTAKLTVGTHSITAAYSGDTNFGKSTSPAISLAMQSTATTSTGVSLASSKNPTAAGTSVTFTATVSPSSVLAAPPTGSVTFFDGSAALGTVKLASNLTASLTISTLAAGKHSITATYTGDSNYSGSTSSALTETITGGTATTTTTLSASASTVTVGTSVKFTADVTSKAAGTPTGSVTFNDNGASIGTGTLSSGAATLSTSTLAVGSHPITAIYGGDSSFASSTSSVVTVTVNAAAAPGASLTPATAGFGNQTVKTTSAAKTFVLANTGNATLTGIAPSIIGADPKDFAVTTGANACGASLAAGKSCDIYVTFTPQSAASFSAMLSVADDASSSPQSSTLTGTGTSVPVPVASLSPAKFNFPNQTAKTVSGATTFTLSNTGNATLTNIAPSISGIDPSDFAITTGSNACGASLNAGASCSIYVTFTPGSAASFSAMLSVADNASGSPQTAALSGTGTSVSKADFTIGITPSSRSVAPGGSAQYTVTVASSGGSFTNPVALSVSGLPAGATGSFSPTSITPGSGSGTSTLTVQTGASQQSASGSSIWPVTTPALALLFLLPFRRWRKVWKGKLLMLVSGVACLASAASLTGCGGGFALTQPAHTYTLTITAASGNDTHTTTVQLTVQ